MVSGCLSEATNAYKAIGYKCVELEIKEKPISEEEWEKSLAYDVMQD